MFELKGSTASIERDLLMAQEHQTIYEVRTQETSSTGD